MYNITEFYVFCCQHSKTTVRCFFFDLQYKRFTIIKLLKFCTII